jgi:DNA-binding GntR family transcriptional regulator
MPLRLTYFRSSTVLIAGQRQLLVIAQLLHFSSLTAVAVSIDYNSRMDEVTQILVNIESGDPAAADTLLPLVYDQLRRLAAGELQKKTIRLYSPTDGTGSRSVLAIGRPET